VRKLQNGRVRLALHDRKPGAGTPLLLLHSLYGSSAEWSAEVEDWPGAVFALDFSGHGASAWIRGGSYHIEHFLSDADRALREVGPAALAGAGVGAWYALLLAGARAEQVPGCLLLPGRGLAGAGPEPDPFDVQRRIPNEEEVAAFVGDCDPFCRGMEGDPRPPGFIEPFACGPTGAAGRGWKRDAALVADGACLRCRKRWNRARCGTRGARPRHRLDDRRDAPEDQLAS